MIGQMDIWTRAGNSKVATKRYVWEEDGEASEG